MADAQNSSHFRELELVCRQQAELTTNEATRRALLAMADEYAKQAELLERQPPRDVNPRE
jgi:hypothetical protein